jgi:hypothetical protein
MNQAGSHINHGQPIQCWDDHNGCLTFEGTPSKLGFALKLIADFSPLKSTINWRNLSIYIYIRIYIYTYIYIYIHIYIITYWLYTKRCIVHNLGPLSPWAKQCCFHVDLWVPFWLGWVITFLAPAERIGEQSHSGSTLFHFGQVSFALIWIEHA